MAVTVDDVKDLMVLPAAETADLSLHLATAQLIVSEDLSGLGHSADRLDKITLFLAAHFVVLALEKGGLTRKDVGEAAESYRVPTPGASGLNATRYGQQAMALDTSGTLAENANGMKKAEFRVV